MVRITEQPLSEVQEQLTPLDELGQRVTELTIENLRLQERVKQLENEKEGN